MSDRDFEIGNRKFKLNKIDTFKQFHIVRRLAPILGDMISAAQKYNKFKASGSHDEKASEENFTALVTPIMNGVSKLSDADASLVLLGLCSAVEIQQMPIGNWAKVATDAGLMFQDIELPILLQIAGRAFMYNLSGFFAVLPQA